MAQQDLNPSAPPEEVEDFQWIEDSMKKTNENVYPVLNQNNNNNNNNNNQGQAQEQQQQQQIQGFVQPKDMAIPDAITQQVIYQRIMEEQRKKKEAQANAQKLEQKQDPPQQENEEKKFPQQPVPLQQPQNNGLNVLNGPKPSYMDQDVQYPETALYKAAGLCVWRPKENGKGIQIMMGLEKNNNSLSFFGGKRDDSDKTCVDTAIREFHEETGKKLDDETLSQIRRMLMNDKDRKIFWKAEWLSVLYFYQMSYDYDIVKDYSKWRQFNAEMKNLYWIDFEKIYKSVFVTGNPIKISKNKYALRSFVVGTLLHEENKKYLLDLHIKNGGDINEIKPKYGGTIRNTIKSFKNIPKVIRLDILNPLTHCVLYHRWIDMNILEIEDLQILTMLITSICPELQRNFLLYYTENNYFKTSKKQFVIDTIPAFTTLKQNLSSKKKLFITKINILPTFIISDNFKGVSFSFKPSDVSWKEINPSNDDEKGQGIVGSMYNKAANYAQSWFGGDNDDSDEYDLKNGDSDEMLWKWQFMNDKNKFEDFKSKNSKHIEKNFVNGYSFTNFKRNNTNYQANFKTMCQKNLSTNKIRAIRRVPASVEGDKSNDNNVNNNYGYSGYYYRSPALQYYKWQFQEDNGSWTDYDVNVSKQLNSFKVSWDNNVQNYHYHIYRSKKKFDSRYTFSTNIKNKNNGITYQYLIDVKHFKQQNVSTKKERFVRQIPVYENNNNYGYNHNQLISLPYFINNNVMKYKWQFKDDGYNKWSDYDTSTSQYIEQQYLSNYYQSPFTVTCNKNKNYKIHFNSMQQQSLLSGKFRQIRRQPLIAGINIDAKHRWEWQDDDGTWRCYNNTTSKQIESACNSGIKKYFFVSNKNNNSYEINFGAMSQYNVQSGKQRNVRKIALEPKWKGAGPNPKKFKGPKGIDRRTFADNKQKNNKIILDLYCIVGDNVANEINKGGKMIRGSLGPFGAGLYFYDNIEICKKMAKDRTVSNRGNLVKCRVFIGKEHDVSNMDDKQYDFITLQKMSYDSVSRSLGFYKEYIVYNNDQVCIVKVEKYH